MVSVGVHGYLNYDLQKIIVVSSYLFCLTSFHNLFLTIGSSLLFGEGIVEAPTIYVLYKLEVGYVLNSPIQFSK